MLRTLLLYLIYWKEKFRLYKQVSFNGFTVVYAFRKSRICWGRNIVINSHSLSNLAGMHQRTILVARDGGKIRLGDNVSVSGTTIYALESVEIGDNTQIGVNTIIMDNDFHPLNITARRMNDRNAIRRKPVRIGNDCFIGMNVIICKGTVLGDRCIVGAGSVVCGVYPDDSVIIGNPAIRKR
ncbi:MULTISPECIES: acyltransferase [Parabacteroides]|uniref:Maltose/galactoside acetyltransferase domain-containing protein n=1 Tax=Parabacteroides gordonii MS-1 = DSM 23371 TaxID=1203610 RepID=A0A0F5IUL2_9BACT|nr:MULTISPECIES: acyltransferase [Parabacteroides]KKB49193.1 hypothetical protein HMPREF1536_04257 [Parabacteroides gordonii MS-1 = DSM 23371]KKB51452.1 hypothetical protein HMPREF1212_02182 [Parabacteroides sp. HGS0025]MCA5585463.1 acyltransferase [Parabacteroides gordonii]RGP16761.1 acyltransferase [Parabacteroides gordonii]